MHLVTDASPETTGQGAEPSAAAAERARVTTDLLPALMELKTLVRQLSHVEVSGHAGSSLAALALVERCSPARVSDLAEVAHLDPSVVSRQAKALKASGLVEVDVDPRDGRARRLRLSDDGERTLAQGRTRMAQLVAERLADWSVDDLGTLTAGLRRLVDDLGRPSSPTFVTPDRNPA